jgi:cell division protein FtsB
MRIFKLLFLSKIKQGWFNENCRQAITDVNALAQISHKQIEALRFEYNDLKMRVLILERHIRNLEINPHAAKGY